MAKVKSLYFEHDFDAMSDEKIRAVRRKYGMLGYGVYFGLLELLAKNGGTMARNYADIAYDMHVEEDVLRSVVEDFGLFDIDGESGVFSSERLCSHLERMEGIRESRSIAGKASAARRANNAAQTSNDNPTNVQQVFNTCSTPVEQNSTNSQQNPTYIDIDKDIDNNPPPLNTRAKNENDPCLETPALISTIAMERLTESLIDRLKGDEMKQVGIITGNPELITKDNFNEMVEKFRSWMRITERRSQSYGQLCGTFLSWLRIESKDNPNNNSYGKSRNGETEKVSQKLRDLRYGGTSDADAYSAPI